MIRAQVFITGQSVTLLGYFYRLSTSSGRCCLTFSCPCVSMFWEIIKSVCFGLKHNHKPP